MPDIELSYCVVNTSQRELLLRGLDAIAHERAELPFATEVLVLDNGSRDGSAQAARAHPAVDEVIALEQRRGKALNDSELLRRARGRYALLLNEDSELRPGATLALHEALERHPDAACAGAKLVRPETGAEPGLRLALPDAAHGARGRAVPAPALHRAKQGRPHMREVDWCQSSALLVRREAAAQVDYLDPDFFVYSDEVDFAKRLRDAGWRSLYVPSAVAIHHEQLSTDTVPEPRIVETGTQPRPLHAQAPFPAAARAVRWLTAWLLRGASARGAAAARPLPQALLAPRHSDAVALARRGPARGRGRLQPPNFGKTAPHAFAAATYPRRWHMCRLHKPKVHAPSGNRTVVRKALRYGCKLFEQHRHHALVQLRARHAQQLLTCLLLACARRDKDGR